MNLFYERVNFLKKYRGIRQTRHSVFEESMFDQKVFHCTSNYSIQQHIVLPDLHQTYHLERHGFVHCWADPQPEDRRWTLEKKTYKNDGTHITQSYLHHNIILQYSSGFVSGLCSNAFFFVVVRCHIQISFSQKGFSKFVTHQNEQNHLPYTQEPLSLFSLKLDNKLVGQFGIWKDSLKIYTNLFLFFGQDCNFILCIFEIRFQFLNLRFHLQIFIWIRWWKSITNNSITIEYSMGKSTF